MADVKALEFGWGEVSGGCQLTAEESQLFAGLIRDQFGSEGHQLIPVCDWAGRGGSLLYILTFPPRPQERKVHVTHRCYNRCGR